MIGTLPVQGFPLDSAMCEPCGKKRRSEFCFFHGYRSEDMSYPPVAAHFRKQGTEGLLKCGFSIQTLILQIEPCPGKFFPGQHL